MGRIETEAFVLSATGPDVGWTTGTQDLRLAVTLPGGRIVEVADDPKVPVERWIVRGMTVPVSIDPGKPQRCEVLVDQVPLLEDRAAARDWALLNLEEVTARVRVVRYDIQLAFSAGQRGVFEAAFEQTRALEESQAFADAAAKHAQRPSAPVVDAEGRLRGTAALIAFQEPPSSRRGEAAGGTGWRGKRLHRIWLYGYGPYVRMDEHKFKRRNMHDSKDYLAGGVPVSVDPNDLDDVRFLWDEWDYDPHAALQQRVQGHMTGQQGQLNLLMGAQAQAIMAATPPEMRAALAAQLRASGMPVPDEYL